MSGWDEFCGQRRGALERFVNGDAGPYKQLWSHADDVTIFGGWGGYEYLRLLRGRRVTSMTVVAGMSRARVTSDAECSRGR